MMQVHVVLSVRSGAIKSVFRNREDANTYKKKLNDALIRTKQTTRFEVRSYTVQ